MERGESCFNEAILSGCHLQNKPGTYRKLETDGRTLMPSCVQEAGYGTTERTQDDRTFFEVQQRELQRTVGSEVKNLILNLLLKTLTAAVQVSSKNRLEELSLIHI